MAAVDFLIVGGGIVGLATAMALLERFPTHRFQLVEKEATLACHQSGHNSGVIHAGVYYAPGSLKAELCRQGVSATINFCEEHQIPYQQCGKMLVATTAVELARMQALFERCKRNGLAVEQLDAGALREREPNIVGLGALFVAETGITDYPAITGAMADLFKARGGLIAMQTRVHAISEARGEVKIGTNQGVFTAKQLIVCGGTQADRLARMAGLETDFSIVPFRGEYYRLNHRHNRIVNHLIYPVPDPDLPFLGVHLTRMIDGSVSVGPNAVLGLAREGYRKTDIHLNDISAMALDRGFWRLVAKNWRSGLSEWHNSLSKTRYLDLCRKYCPTLTLGDLEPYPAGIRAQAVLHDGTLVHDFLIKQSAHMLHVCNAPSPAATSSIPIGQHVAAMVAAKMAAMA